MAVRVSNGGSNDVLIWAKKKKGLESVVKTLKKQREREEEK